jgi:hypothetical protein
VLLGGAIRVLVWNVFRVHLNVEAGT